ncbi:MAG: hypothetical protein EXS05_04865 [Planctomycetaceae bacterium]|nr:hypothetical protein [Planctomycetaceae bacterium]
MMPLPRVWSESFAHGLHCRSTCDEPSSCSSNRRYLQIAWRPAVNDDSLARMGDGTKRKTPISVFDLPASLLSSVHKFRKRKAKRPRDRTHFPAILGFVYRQKFVTASQIQFRFSSVLRSHRTARRHLAEMQESLGYLELVPAPSPIWPKIYSISRCGMRKLARSFEAKAIRWEPTVMDRGRQKGFSISHVVHELFISEVLNLVWAAATAHADTDLLKIERRSLASQPAFLLHSRRRLIPDALFLLRHGTRGLILTCLEVDTGADNLKNFTAKMGRYSEWAVSEEGRRFLIELYRRHGATDPRPSFRLGIVCAESRYGAVDRRVAAIQRTAYNQPPACQAVERSAVACRRDSDRFQVSRAGRPE